MKYKVSDIVLVKARAGDAIPKIHVRLIKRIVVAPSKGTAIDWAGYSGWECVLIYEKEADLLRKKWSIPLSFPDNIKMFTYDEDIIKKVKKWCMKSVS